MAVHAQSNCPRDKTLLQEIQHNGAFVDRCTRCTGVFFDQGEMFAALGTTADPSLWDSPATGGNARPGTTPCPRCGSHMLLQDVVYGGDKVEIDRCGSCSGMWLDATEADRLMTIGAKLLDIARAEAEKARKELDAMGDVDFNAGKTGGILHRFLAMFRKKN